MQEKNAAPVPREREQRQKIDVPAKRGLRAGRTQSTPRCARASLLETRAHRFIGGRAGDVHLQSQRARTVGRKQSIPRQPPTHLDTAWIVRSECGEYAEDGQRLVARCGQSAESVRPGAPGAAAAVPGPVVE